VFRRKYRDREPPENATQLHKVLHRLNEANRGEKLRLDPLTQKIEHLGGRDQGTHPKPRTSREEGLLREGGMKKSPWGRSARGGEEPPRKSRERRRRFLLSTYGTGAGGGRLAGKEKTDRKNLPGAGYIRPRWGHRTLLMWHRTRPVTTELTRREDFKSTYHRTMATGRWP